MHTSLVQLVLCTSLHRILLLFGVIFLSGREGAWQKSVEQEAVEASRENDVDNVQESRRQGGVSKLQEHTHWYRLLEGSYCCRLCSTVLS